MQELLSKLWNITIEDAINSENNDLQFIALKNLYLNMKNKDFYLSLVLINSIICYQLSSTWEEYWNEFSEYFAKNEISNFNNIEKVFFDFLSNSRWNKRLIWVKIKRIEKLKLFLDEFKSRESYYYDNMRELLLKLSSIMNQKIEAKTMVFAIKMFWYAWRIFSQKISFFPGDIFIPIDSRITKLYEIYNTDPNLWIKDFYLILSNKLNIPLLHLDAILWTKKDLFIR